jgi:hypothetical protein
VSGGCSSVKYSQTMPCGAERQRSSGKRVRQGMAELME